MVATTIMIMPPILAGAIVFEIHRFKQQEPQTLKETFPRK
jgi:hypothetical protein